jgi:hypothetical protein
METRVTYPTNTTFAHAREKALTNRQYAKKESNLKNQSKTKANEKNLILMPHKHFHHEQPLIFILAIYNK